MNKYVFTLFIRINIVQMKRHTLIFFYAQSISRKYEVQVSYAYKYSNESVKKSPFIESHFFHLKVLTKLQLHIGDIASMETVMVKANSCLPSQDEYSNRTMNSCFNQPRNRNGIWLTGQIHGSHIYHLWIFQDTMLM